MGSSQWTRLTRRRVLVILTLAGVLVGAWLWMDVQPAPIEIEVVSTRQSTPNRPPRTFIEAPVEARVDEPDADSGEPARLESAHEVAQQNAERWASLGADDMRMLFCDLTDAFPAADQFDELKMRFEPVDPSTAERPKVGGAQTSMRDGIVISPIPVGPWQAVAVFENAAELRIRWNEVDAGEVAECTDVEIIRQLSGIYLIPTGEPLAGGKLTGCGRDLPLVDNEPIWVAIPPEPCTVAISMRRPGRFAVGPTIDVVPDSETDIEVFVPWPLSSDLRPLSPQGMEGLRLTLALLEKRCSGPDTDECPFSRQEFDADALRDELAAAEAAWLEEEGAVPEWDPSGLE